MDNRSRKSLLQVLCNQIPVTLNGGTANGPAHASATDNVLCQERIRVELAKCANSMKLISSYEMIQFDETMLAMLDNQLLAIMQCVANARFELLQLYTLNERVHDGDRNENV